MMKCSALIVIFISSLLAASVTDAAPNHTKGRSVKPLHAGTQSRRLRLATESC